MIPALTCLLLPFLGDCPAFVRSVPAIGQVVQHKAYYSGKEIRVTGRVRRLDQWTSKNGAQSEQFLICQGACVHVYMRAHSAIRNGELVTVSGPYYEAYYFGRRVFPNEIEASQLLPRE